jgi:hypothetical protein
MVFAGTIMLLAAMVPLQKAVAIDVEIHPKAIVSEQAPLDLTLVGSAIARSLDAAGMDVVPKGGVPQLKLSIMIVRSTKSLSAKHTVTIAAYTQMLDAAGRSDSSPLGLQAASCTGSARSGLDSSSLNGTQLAIARCIGRLADQISSNVVRMRRTKFVQ